MKKFIFFLFTANILFAQQIISVTEKNALLSIYESTGGEKWSLPWDLSKTPKDWYGVKIKNKHVTALNLRGNGLKGNFPSGFSGLAYLEVLDLSNNNLSGEVSASLTNLSKLKSLSINDNFLTGDPSPVLSGFGSLTELSIGHNKFEINNIDNLLQSFPDLKILDLSGFNLTSVPQKISALNKLEALNLSDNALKTGFGNLNGLAFLLELNLAGNQLKVLPTQIGSLTQLKSLNLSRNLLSANFETPLSPLQNLEWLSLENNQLEKLPTNIGTFKNLISLNLGRNLLSGSLSPLTSLLNLEQLFLNHNKLKDAFPADLLQLKKLQMLSLTGNNLSGILPARLPSLIFLDDNRFALADIKTYLDSKVKFANFTYSPQRYDEKLVVSATPGENISLKQALSGDDYAFTWFKNLDIKQNGNLEQFYLNNLKEEDFTSYTCEAYFARKYPDYFLEISFFREPVTVNTTLNTKESVKGLSIYPNPASDYLYVRSENEKVDQISIFDAGGKLLITDSGPNKLQVNVRAFPSAAYIILIKTPKGNKVFKFIKK